MLLRQCCYSTGYPKSAPSTTSSQQTSLGSRAPRTATEHWDFLYHINHGLEVERIVGQVTLLVHFHLRFLSYYPLLIQFLIKLPSSLKPAHSPQQASEHFQASWLFLTHGRANYNTKKQVNRHQAAFLVS